jgi:hypothetical protein
LSSPNSLLLDRYRFPSHGMPDFGFPGDLKEPKGFFRFGSDAICFGRVAGKTRTAADSDLFDASGVTSAGDGKVHLPFDPVEVIDGLRYERYMDSASTWLGGPRARSIYYRLRPLLPDSLRRQLQKTYLQGWNRTAFPSLPVDRSVDILLERLLTLTMEAWGKKRLPFIWFWPDGHKACAIVTHDIETVAGRDFTSRLVDIDESFDIRSSIQIVPEKRYEIPEGFLAELRSRGVEINLHGLDHEGNLFEDWQVFREAARKINDYAERFGARGFRSPVMYRKADWFKELSFSYDMSYPTVARLEPQSGGCCTLLPYSLPGGMTELPLTTSQDYTLFYMLRNYDMAVWKQQVGLVLEGHGLLSFIVHPDYVQSAKAQAVYRQLLTEIAKCRDDQRVWTPLPGEVDRWWRERSQMQLVRCGNDWRIEGPGCERAVIAYACRDGNRLVYEFAKPVPTRRPSVLVKEGTC